MGPRRASNTAGKPGVCCKLCADVACNARRPVLILLIVAFAVRGLLGVGVVLLVVAPWSVRNARLHGGFAAIETNAPLNFWRGNGADAFAGRDAEETLHDAWRFDSVPVSPVAAHTPRRRVERARIDLGAPQPSDLEIIRYASREARRAILSDPAAFISRIPTRLFDMWNPTSFLLRHLQIGTYAEVPGWLAVPISSLAVLAYLLVVALACVGLVLGRRRPETWLVVLIVAGFSAITAVSFGLTHFRLPLMPLLMLLAAGACIRWLPRAGGSPRVAASVALTVVSLGLSGCGRSDERPLPQGPNVLWVVWDTARSDRMGLYGHDLPTTPRLDAWARDARVFENAISTAGSTIPSHASMFTGLLPSEHCAHNDSPRLADELVTLAELMWDAGYRTYLYSENPNVSADPNRNLAQGFEQTEHPWSPDLAEQAFDIVWNKLGDDASDRELKERLRSAREEGVFPRWSIKAAGPLAERALLEWLEDGDAQRPFFAFVNYMEAHRPHIAPRSYRRKLMSPEDVERSYQVDRSWNSMWEYVFGFREYSDEKLRLTRATYDACLLELDDLFGNLLDALEPGGWLENTIVIVTSDHGEHLGEQHMLDHQYTVYEPVLRVPLIVHYPKRVEPGRDPRPVSNFDLFPTLLELTGVAPPPGLDSAARSLLDPLEERGRLAEEPAASTVGIAQILKNHPDWNPEPHRRQLRAWTDGNWKYIWRSKGLPSLYDLSSDPMEHTDTISSEPERAVALSRALDAFYKPRSACVTSDATPPVPEMSEEQRARLEALGYGSPDSSR